MTALLEALLCLAAAIIIGPAVAAHARTQRQWAEDDAAADWVVDLRASCVNTTVNTTRVDIIITGA